MIAPTTRRLLPCVAALVAVATLLSACGSSKYQYVKNSDRGLYLKLPSSWETFDLSAEEAERRPDAIFPPRPWSIGFDAADKPSTDHIGSESPPQPVGIVRVSPLATAEPRSSISLKYLRSLVLGSEGDLDPLALASNGQPGLEIVSYDELKTADGHWGTRIVITVTEDAGEPNTYAHVAMVDPGLEYLYSMRVWCEPECYRDNQNEINRVLESWTIQER